MAAKKFRSVAVHVCVRMRFTAEQLTHYWEITDYDHCPHGNDLLYVSEWEQARKCLWITITVIWLECGSDSSLKLQKKIVVFIHGDTVVFVGRPVFCFEISAVHTSMLESKESLKMACFSENIIHVTLSFWCCFFSTIFIIIFPSMRLSLSADLSLDHFAMRRFYNDKLSALMTPSQKR